MIQTESVTYGRKFDLGNYQSVSFEMIVWADVVDPEQQEAILQSLWKLVKNNVRYAYVRKIRAVDDPSIICDNLSALEGAVRIKTISMTFGGKFNTDKRMENATISASKWYNLDTGENVFTACEALWDSLFINVMAAMPDSSTPLSSAVLGVYPEEES